MNFVLWKLYLNKELTGSTNEIIGTWISHFWSWNAIFGILQNITCETKISRRTFVLRLLMFMRIFVGGIVD